jgi:hypothetical protein
MTATSESLSPQGGDGGDSWSGTRLLARHAREHGPAEGYPCLANLAQGTVCKILDQEDVKPHKVRYHLERRDANFAEKMAEVLCVYRQVKILKKATAVSKKKPSDAVAIISYDEKPGIQAIASTAPDLPPEPGVHATFTREDRQAFRSNEQFYAASDTWLASDQSGFLEGDDHLVDGGWADAEVALHIGFGGRSPEHA